MNQTPCKHGTDTVQKPCKPCGAKTRAGTPCKRLDTANNGRCRLHGGKSTGPLTESGKEQARINGRLGGRKPKTQVFTGFELFSECEVLFGSPPSPQAATLPKTLPVPPIESRSESRSEKLVVSPGNEPKPLNTVAAQARASKPTIRCSDCKHLSAAFTCLTRHTITITNEPRDCAEARDWRA